MQKSFARFDDELVLIDPVETGRWVESGYRPIRNGRRFLLERVDGGVIGTVRG